MKFGALFLAFVSTNAFVDRPTPIIRSSTTVLAENNYRKPMRLSSAILAESSPNPKKIAARILGYIIGAGALGLYTPIIYDLATTKTAAGISVATWIYNFLGFTAGMVYPLKKRFPIASYIDNIALWFQSFVILFLTCLLKGMGLQFAIGMIVYCAVAYVFMTQEIPMKSVKVIQMGSCAACNYAQIPQIILNWKRQSAAESLLFSAFLSTIGNLIKVFTTVQLTNDWLIGFGHVLGFTTNGSLMVQVMAYNNLLWRRKT
mmetsp:Transcript_19732/g.19841  ORF Transcript_19732/g.19841 Transcript_19732/m.19841 type:complete len:260 (-) Transcript_19732:52-831(-)